MKTLFAIGKNLRDHGKLLMSHDTAEFSVVTREALNSWRAYETTVRYKGIIVDGHEWTTLDRSDDVRTAIIRHNHYVEMLMQA